MQKIMKISRASGRAIDQLRPLKVTYDVSSYAAGSALFEIGNTKILCAVTIQSSVPYFLRGRKTGWLTAEYSLLPSSTPVRTVREITTNKRSGRAIEISRLIGRALRAAVDLTAIGEHTIFVDCDVLQADGGTKTAAITGAYLALKAAEAKWKAQGLLVGSKLIKEEISAISVGLSSGGPLLDTDFTEDNLVESQYDFVLTRAGKVVEIQGCTERTPITWDDFELMRMLAVQGVQEIFFFYDTQGAVPIPKDSGIMKDYMNFASQMFDEQV